MAGDVNNDTIADVIIGAHNGSPENRTYAGTSYVIYGKTRGSADIDLALLSPLQGFRILGATAGDASGYSVSRAGDFNNDSIADIFIGAPNSYSNAGASYVIYGKTGGLLDIDLHNFTSAQGFKMIGAIGSGPGINGDEDGISVSGSGDVNNDGIADIITGAYAASFASGTNYVIYGKTGGSSDINDLSNFTSAQGFRVFGEETGDHSGYVNSMVGDVNADGIDDIMIGAYMASRNGKINAGLTYVIYGQQGGFAQDINMTLLSQTQGFRMYGATPYSYSGHSNGIAGDFNFDGIKDIVVGEYGGTPFYQQQPYQRPQAGITYLIYGLATTFLPDMDLEFWGQFHLILVASQ
jgi:hypothetical protein